jgi:hypothetical protein
MSVDEDVEKFESSHPAGGKLKRVDILKNNLSISQKVKHKVIIGLSQFNF